MRFAILEDDPAQMEVLTGWLREAGHDVHGFGLARELMRVASRESFDLFLVDWVLPDLTGEQVLRWLRVERGNDTPAIFITSRDAEEDIANAFSAGADDYLMLRALLHVAADTGQLPETRDIELSIILNFNPDAGHTVFQAQNIFLSANAQ